MDNLENLRGLLENGIITKGEYELIKKRFNMSQNEYNHTWQDILDDFYEWCTGKYSISTAKGYKTCLYKFVVYVTKEDDNKSALACDFKPYTFRTVNSFVSKLQEDGIGNQAISKTKYALIVLGNYLETKGIKTPDISSIKISITNEVNTTTVVLHEDEIKEIAHVSDLRSEVCILLCYEGALKRIELVNLKVSDFDFKKNQMFIRDSKDKIDRVCILSGLTMKLVKGYIEELYYNIDKWNNSRISKGKEPREDFGYIFQSVKMTVPSYALLQTMVKENAKNYYLKQGLDEEKYLEKVSNVTFESIRNSRKVYLLSRGIDIKDVMQICGDRNYMSTYRFIKLVPLLYPETINVN